MKQISKAYAEAIFSIALEQKKVTEFAEKFEQLEALLTKHPDYCSYLKTPALPLHERLTAIERDGHRKTAPCASVTPCRRKSFRI